MDRTEEEFDNLFDWGGATNGIDTSMPDVKVTQAPILPISPLSATHHDFSFATAQPQSLTAPSVYDLPTPRHSSSSPDTRPSTDVRLSGETLRDDTSPINARPLKRKLSPNDTNGIVPLRELPPPAAKKRPHNIIEKRYRANLNEKIAELRDSVPSLRTTQKARVTDGLGAESEDEDLNGLTPSNKLNKASILTKAVEYIRHLEFRTKRLEDENRSLKERLETLDKVIAQGGHDSHRATAFTSESLIEGGSATTGPSNDTTSDDQESKPAQPVQGLIPIPDSWRRLRQSQTQEHYGHIYSSSSQNSVLKGKWPRRVMLGSLAGLMVMEGFSEHEHDSDSGQKGLFGIPLELLDGWEFLRSPRIYLSAFAQFCRAGGVLPLAKGFLALTIAAFLIFTYLFNSKPPRKENFEEERLPSDQAPVPASPIEVRRRAWSTSMQVLKLPHHNFFPEWMAVTAEWINYVVRCTFGYQAYFWLTGRAIEDDAARIKAWDIAIDAQLAGGDVEVSRSRVVLTSFGSGTLPKTPIRLMQKSLHCRVLLWNVGQRDSAPYRFANGVAKFFAAREWQHARRLQMETKAHDSERLPNNLAALLAMECEDVFTDTVIQRAYNLMYDRPTHDQAEDTLMDVVVDDHAIRSPLDAIAAWRSTAALRRVFETSMQNPEETGLLQDQLSLALKIAPQDSAAQLRALAAHALFGKSNRNTFHLRASDILRLHKPAEGTSPGLHTPGPFFIDSSTPISARADIENCLHCAKTLMVLDQENSVEQAQLVFASRTLETNKTTTILTAAALTYLIARLPELDQHINQVGSFMPRADCPIADCQSSTWFVVRQKRRQSMASNDTGYESLDDNTLDLWDDRALYEV
ncbi:uncharacterized protein HMPREF1541_02336 [Cyphellophora europaea CBS 101466]|uniref:BHLH domain-containing protein n=1 Tax=Cyphellophora europaea (strain CBS 101466) TaxID=1220924 RepID=W2S554_CYPE1|nr:uncharacterized protein HMPREF1541_02336 [Cyphellophora europaea CBS 101466]ETN43178.1 hypothetical protein HMPREF1541_02336 [Cyphellophora europaea CBS 101466]